MTAIIVFLVLFAVLGVAAAMGWTADSRDSEYAVGPIIDRSLHPLGR